MRLHIRKTQRERALYINSSLRILALLSVSLFAHADININQNEFCITKKVVSWIETRNKNLTRQNFDYSCGSAALSTIFSYYYDKNITENDILIDIANSIGLYIEKLDVKKKSSISFADLTEYVQRSKFRAIGIAVGFDEILNLKIPAIIFVKIRNQEHFTALKSSDETNVYLADPTFGNISVSHSKFKEMFFQRAGFDDQGKILIILPKKEIATNKSFMEIIPFGTVIYETIKIPRSN